MWDEPSASLLLVAEPLSTVHALALGHNFRLLFMSPEHPVCSPGPLGLPDNDTATPSFPFSPRAVDCQEGSGELQAGSKDIPASCHRRAGPGAFLGWNARV